MATKTNEERYMEWLGREEDTLGMETTERATADYDEMRRLLYDELGYEPSGAQIDALMSAGEMRYELLPLTSTQAKTFERWWGRQTTYRDVVTGRFVSKEDVFALMGVAKGL